MENFIKSRPTSELTMQKVSNSCRIIYSQIGNKDKNEIQIFGSQFTSIFKIIIPAYQLIRERKIPTELLKIWRTKTENVGDDKVLKGAAKYFTSNDHSMNDTLNQYDAEWKITSNRGDKLSVADKMTAHVYNEIETMKGIALDSLDLLHECNTICKEIKSPAKYGGAAKSETLDGKFNKLQRCVVLSKIVQVPGIFDPLQMVDRNELHGFSFDDSEFNVEDNEISDKVSSDDERAEVETQAPSNVGTKLDIEPDNKEQRNDEDEYGDSIEKVIRNVTRRRKIKSEPKNKKIDLGNSNIPGDALPVKKSSDVEPAADVSTEYEDYDVPVVKYVTKRRLKNKSPVSNNNKIPSTIKETVDFVSNDQAKQPKNEGHVPLNVDGSVSNNQAEQPNNEGHVPLNVDGSVSNNQPEQPNNGGQVPLNVDGSVSNNQAEQPNNEGQVPLNVDGSVSNNQAEQPNNEGQVPLNVDGSVSNNQAEQPNNEGQVPLNVDGSVSNNQAEQPNNEGQVPLNVDGSVSNNQAEQPNNEGQVPLNVDGSVSNNQAKQPNNEGQVPLNVDGLVRNNQAEQPNNEGQVPLNVDGSVSNNQAEQPNNEGQVPLNVDGSVSNNQAEQPNNEGQVPLNVDGSVSNNQAEQPNNEGQVPLNVDGFVRNNQGKQPIVESQVHSNVKAQSDNLNVPNVFVDNANHEINNPQEQDDPDINTNNSDLDQGEKTFKPEIENDHHDPSKLPFADIKRDIEPDNTLPQEQRNEDEYDDYFEKVIRNIPKRRIILSKPKIDLGGSNTPGDALPVEKSSDVERAADIVSTDNDEEYEDFVEPVVEYVKRRILKKPKSDVLNNNEIPSAIKETMDFVSNDQAKQPKNEGQVPPNDDGSVHNHQAKQPFMETEAQSDIENIPYDLIDTSEAKLKLPGTELENEPGYDTHNPQEQDKPDSNSNDSDLDQGEKTFEPEPEIENDQNGDALPVEKSSNVEPAFNNQAKQPKNEGQVAPNVDGSVSNDQAEQPIIKTEAQLDIENVPNDLVDTSQAKSKLPSTKLDNALGYDTLPRAQRTEHEEMRKQPIAADSNHEIYHPQRSIPGWKNPSQTRNEYVKPLSGEQENSALNDEGNPSKTRKSPQDTHDFRPVLKENESSRPVNGGHSMRTIKGPQNNIEPGADIVNDGLVNNYQPQQPRVEAQVFPNVDGVVPNDQGKQPIVESQVPSNVKAQSDNENVPNVFVENANHEINNPQEQDNPHINTNNSDLDQGEKTFKPEIENDHHDPSKLPFADIKRDIEPDNTLPQEQRNEDEYEDYIEKDEHNVTRRRRKIRSEPKKEKIDLVDSNIPGDTLPVIKSSDVEHAADVSTEYEDYDVPVVQYVTKRRLKDKSPVSNNNKIPSTIKETVEKSSDVEPAADNEEYEDYDVPVVKYVTKRRLKNKSPVSNNNKIPSTIKETTELRNGLKKVPYEFSPQENRGKELNTANVEPSQDHSKQELCQGYTWEALLYSVQRLKDEPLKELVKSTQITLKKARKELNNGIIQRMIGRVNRYSKETLKEKTDAVIHKVFAKLETLVDTFNKDAEYFSNQLKESLGKSPTLNSPTEPKQREIYNTKSVYNTQLKNELRSYDFKAQLNKVISARPLGNEPDNLQESRDHAFSQLKSLQEVVERTLHGINCLMLAIYNDLSEGITVSQMINEGKQSKDRRYTNPFHDTEDEEDNEEVDPSEKHDVDNEGPMKVKSEDEADNDEVDQFGPSEKHDVDNEGPMKVGSEDEADNDEVDQFGPSEKYDPVAELEKFLSDDSDNDIPKSNSHSKVVAPDQLSSPHRIGLGTSPTEHDHSNMNDDSGDAATDEPFKSRNRRLNIIGVHPPTEHHASINKNNQPDYMVNQGRTLYDNDNDGEKGKPNHFNQYYKPIRTIGTNPQIGNFVHMPPSSGGKFQPNNEPNAIPNSNGWGSWMLPQSNIFTPTLTMQSAPSSLSWPSRSNTFSPVTDPEEFVHMPPLSPARKLQTYNEPNAIQNSNGWGSWMQPQSNIFTPRLAYMQSAPSSLSWPSRSNTFSPVTYTKEFVPNSFGLQNIQKKAPPPNTGVDDLSDLLSKYPTAKDKKRISEDEDNDDDDDDLKGIDNAKTPSGRRDPFGEEAEMSEMSNSQEPESRGQGTDTVPKETAPRGVKVKTVPIVKEYVSDPVNEDEKRKEQIRPTNDGSSRKIDDETKASDSKGPNFELGRKKPEKKPNTKHNNRNKKIENQPSASGENYQNEPKNRRPRKVTYLVEIDPTSGTKTIIKLDRKQVKRYAPERGTVIYKGSDKNKKRKVTQFKNINKELTENGKEINSAELKYQELLAQIKKFEKESLKNNYESLDGSSDSTENGILTDSADTHVVGEELNGSQEEDEGPENIESRSRVTLENTQGADAQKGDHDGIEETYPGVEKNVEQTERAINDAAKVGSGTPVSKKLAELIKNSMSSKKSLP